MGNCISMLLEFGMCFVFFNCFVFFIMWYSIFHFLLCLYLRHVSYTRRFFFTVVTQFLLVFSMKLHGNKSVALQNASAAKLFNSETSLFLFEILFLLSQSYFNCICCVFYVSSFVPQQIFCL